MTKQTELQKLKVYIDAVVPLLQEISSYLYVPEDSDDSTQYYSIGDKFAYGGEEYLLAELPFNTSHPFPVALICINDGEIWDDGLVKDPFKITQEELEGIIGQNFDFTQRD